MPQEGLGHPVGSVQPLCLRRRHLFVGLLKLGPMSTASEISHDLRSVKAFSVVDDLIDHLSSAKFISTLDLTKGYWQVPVAPESRHKTGFVTPFGKYQFKKMPFGLQGAPATFQRLMNGLFGDLSQNVAAYLDDIIIFSPTWEEHLLLLKTVLHRLTQAGLTIRADKCQLAMAQCH